MIDGNCRYNGKKIVLCVLDGFSFGKCCSSNAFSVAKTNNLQQILQKYPSVMLHASGNCVGLDSGQMGNSEVGHMAIGAGKIIQQDLPMINQAVTSGVFVSSEIIQNAILEAKKNNSNIHIIGLYSSGGVHSHLNHINEIARVVASCDILTKLHIVTDGRDVSPNNFVKNDHFELLRLINKNKNIAIATIMGRYFAMDRDNKWDRIKIATDAIIFGKTENFIQSLEEFAKLNDLGPSDEFIKSYKIADYSGILPNDIVIFANFRADRMRQIAKVFANDYKLYDQEIPKTKLISMMEYYHGLSEKSDILFKKQIIENSLSHIYSNLSLSQLKIAETEKYAHVTFFFNGGKEDLLLNEERIMIPSPNVPTYDLQPEMSAYEIQDTAIEKIKENKTNLIVLNIANGDMVGHTGNFKAAVKAVEVIDEVVGNLLKTCEENDYILLITADHGNIEEMLDCNGEIHTQHTLNKVPLIFCGKEFCNLEVKDNDKLSIANIAPTILKICNISIPKDFEQSIL